MNECSICGGTNDSIGCLGNREYFICRNCGIQSSEEIMRDATDYLDAQDDDWDWDEDEYNYDDEYDEDYPDYSDANDYGGLDFDEVDNW